MMMRVMIDDDGDDDGDDDDGDQDDYVLPQVHSGRAARNRADSRHADCEIIFVLPRLAVRDWRAPRRPCDLDPFCRFKATIRSAR